MMWMVDPDLIGGLVLAAETQPLDSVTTWVNFGVLGLVVLALLTGRLWTKPSVDRLLEEKNRAVEERKEADAQRDAMAALLQDRLLPVVSDFVATTRALMPVLQELHELQKMIPDLQAVIEAGDHVDPPPPARNPRKRRV
jgi:hypothetical protein